MKVSRLVVNAGMVMTTGVPCNCFSLSCCTAILDNAASSLVRSSLVRRERKHNATNTNKQHNPNPKHNPRINGNLSSDFDVINTDEA